jgi:hypothetical protein
VLDAAGPFLLVPLVLALTWLLDGSQAAFSFAAGSVAAGPAVPGLACTTGLSKSVIGLLIYYVI